MSVKVSIVIPVYNAQDYIGQTIDNLIEQTVTDFEVLLVDNNSTDDSFSVMEQKVSEDARFHIYKETKKGPAAARNCGLSHASGEWVLFLDADDSFTNDMLERLLEVTEDKNQVVMVVSGYETHKNGETVYVSPPVKETFTIEGMIQRLFEVDHYQGFIWNKLFRRDIIESRRIHFRENIYYNEDRLFIENYLTRCYNMCTIGDLTNPEVQMISATSYHYQLREDSAMAVTRDETTVTEDEVSEIAAFDCMVKDIYENFGLESNLFSVVLKDMAFSELRLFRRMISKEHPFKYSKHPMRMYARAAKRMKISFEKERDAILWKVFVRYGRTGLTYTKNPDFFEEEED